MSKGVHCLTLVFCLFAFATAAECQWLQTNLWSGAPVHSFATYGPYVLAATSEGVALSADSGKSWVMSSVGLRSTNVATVGASGTAFFAATDSGLFRSLDHGVHWTSSEIAVSPSPGSISPIFDIVVRDTDIFAATSSGLFRSTDGGASWSLFAPGGGLSIAVEDSIFLVGGVDAFAYSLDNGVTWTEGRTADRIACGAVAMHGNVMYVGTEGLGYYMSTDRGATWKNNDLGPSIEGIDIVGASVFAVVWDGLGARYEARSDDSGKTWYQPGPRTNELRVLGSIGRTLFAGSFTDGISVSNDMGATWQRIKGGVPREVFSVAATKSRLVAGTTHGIYTSTDDGDHWERCTSGISDTAIATVYARDGYVFASTVDSIFRSTDDGQTWRPANTGEFRMNDASFAKAGNVYYAASRANDHPYWGGVIESVDNGENWSYLDLSYLRIGCLTSIGDHYIAGTELGVRPGGNTFNDLVTALAANDREVYEGTSQNGMLRSIDSGVHWSYMNGSQLRQPVTAIAATDNAVFAVIGGLYRSDRDGALQEVTDDYPLERIYGDRINAILSTPSNIYLATSDGVWKRSLSDFAAYHASVANSNSVSSFELYPNPGSGQIRIRYSPPVQERAEITIESQLGTTLATLYSGELDAREHDLTWSAQALPAGVYWCVIKTDREIQRSLVTVLH